MKVKDVIMPLKIISLLSDGEFHSDKQFSIELDTSHVAIRKHIQTVRNWGVDIFAIPGKGYRLCTPLQLLDENIIRDLLPSGRLSVLPIIDSSNQYLMERIGTTSAQSGDACVVEYQAQGRGRRGRQWISPFGNNLYLSLYWCLEQGVSALGGLSLMVSIIIAEVLQKFGAEGIRVKWPNDLYLNERKLAGILVESSSKATDVAHVVIGAGINLAMSETTADKIDQNWINLQEVGISIDRNLLAVKLTDTLRHALWQFNRYGFAPFITRWQALDNFFNRPVKLISGKQEIKGIARGIDKQGSLLLEQDGNLTAYCSGEISLRSQ